MKKSTMRSILLALSASALLACGSDASTTDCDNNCQQNAGPDGGATIVNVTIGHAGAGQGAVQINGQACEEFPCAVEAEQGSLVTLIAKPTPSSSFGAWTGSCGDEPICEFEATEDIALEATFLVAGELLAQDAWEALETLPRPTASGIDRDGNIYVLGSYRGTPHPDLEEASVRTGYYAKLSAAGDITWIRSFSLGTSSETDYTKVGVGPEGNLYLGGDNRFGKNGFVQRVDPATGDVLWTVNSDLWLSDMQVDGLGNIFVVGRIARDTVGRFGQHQFSSHPEITNYIARISSVGGVSSAVRMPVVGTPVIRGVLPLPEGGVVVSRGHGDIHRLERFAGDGSLQTERDAVASGQLARAPNGDLVVAGSYTHALNWGAASELQAPARANGGFFVGRWQDDGTPIWLRVNTATDGASLQVHNRILDKNLDVADNGDIVVAGVMFEAGSLNLGDGPLPRFGVVDPFLASFSPDGTHRWSSSFGSNSNTSSFDVFSTLHIGSDNQLRALLFHNQPLVTELGTLAAGENILDFQM